MYLKKSYSLISYVGKNYYLSGTTIHDYIVYNPSLLLIMQKKMIKTVMKLENNYDFENVDLK